MFTVQYSTVRHRTAQSWILLELLDSVSSRGHSKSNRHVLWRIWNGGYCQQWNSNFEQARTVAYHGEHRRASAIEFEFWQNRCEARLRCIY